MKNINKLHKGLSIGTFPKTNKEKNKEKLNLKLQNGSFDKRNIREKFWNVDTAFGVIPGNKLHYLYFFWFCKMFDF